MWHSVELDISEHFLDGRIDPDYLGDGGRLRRDATKANGVQFECCAQRGLAPFTNFHMDAVVH